MRRLMKLDGHNNFKESSNKKFAWYKGIYALTIMQYISKRVKAFLVL